MFPNELLANERNHEDLVGCRSDACTRDVKFFLHFDKFFLNLCEFLCRGVALLFMLTRFLLSTFVRLERETCDMESTSHSVIFPFSFSTLRFSFPMACSFSAFVSSSRVSTSFSCCSNSMHLFRSDSASVPPFVSSSCHFSSWRHTSALVRASSA